MSHEILIEKLIQKDLGRGKHSTGIENWLQDCKQTIMINGTVLSWGEVTLNKFINDPEWGLKSTPTKSDDCITAGLWLRTHPAPGSCSQILGRQVQRAARHPWLSPCTSPTPSLAINTAAKSCAAAMQPLARVRNAGVHWQEEGWNLPLKHGQEKKIPPLKIPEMP